MESQPIWFFFSLFVVFKLQMIGQLYGGACELLRRPIFAENN